MQRSAFCRSRRELSNEYLVAKIGFDTAENEPCEVCPIELCSQPFDRDYADSDMPSDVESAGAAAAMTAALQNSRRVWLGVRNSRERIYSHFRGPAWCIFEARSHPAISWLSPRVPLGTNGYR